MLIPAKKTGYNPSAVDIMAGNGTSAQLSAPMPLMWEQEVTLGGDPAPCLTEHSAGEGPDQLCAFPCSQP